MKKFIGILGLGLLLAGCSQGASGKLIPGFEESPLWNIFASDEDKKAYFEERIEMYTAMPVYKICLKWDGYWEYPNERELISQALIRINEDPLKCRNPNKDSVSRARKETQQAQAAAAAARAAAERARILQQQAEQEAFNARREAGWIRINCPSGGENYNCY